MVTNTQPLVAAVSGGVDSIVMLDALATQVPLVVAHVNHGIRSTSDEDEVFVRQLAQSYNLPFTSTKLSLGPNASEEQARTLRYEWLERVKIECGASKIATAHHQDDVFETMIINITRGTGWRGISSLRSTDSVYRPLLNQSKAEVVAYAIDKKLSWREDETNESMRYLRNRIRHMVIPRLSPDQRETLVTLYRKQSSLLPEIMSETNKLLTQYVNEEGLSRHVLIMAEDEVGLELLRTWLGESLEASRMNDLLLFARVALPGAKWSLDGERFIVASTQRLIVLPPRD